MQTVQQTYSIQLPAWSKILASLFPLWLTAIAVTAEGFPRPPVSIETAITCVVLAVVISMLLLWQRWVTIELVLYSFIPLAYVVILDEISTAYKTPFILLCTLVLSMGLVVYQGNRGTWWRVLVLLAAAAIGLGLAWHAAASYWQMTSALGYTRCFPGAVGCPALGDQARPWWALFFGV